MAQYQLIVFLAGEDSKEAIDAYWHGGAREVLDVLSEYDTGEEEVLKVSEVSSATADDESMEIGDYNVIVNPERGTAALEVVIR